MSSQQVAGTAAPQQQNTAAAITPNQSNSLVRKTPATAGGNTGGKVQQTISLKADKPRIQFQPSTAHSTTKNKKFSIIRTIEKQMLSLNPNTQVKHSNFTLDSSSHENLATVSNSQIPKFNQQPPTSSGFGNVLLHQQLHTYEHPSSQENLIRNVKQVNLANQRISFQQAQSLETSQERRFVQFNQQQHPSSSFLHGNIDANNMRMSLEGRPVPYTRQVPSKQRHGSRGNANNAVMNNYFTNQAQNVSPFLHQQQQQQQSDQVILQQYSSIPVKSVSTKRRDNFIVGSAGTTSLAAPEHHQKHINKQASTLMKMYGNSGNHYGRKHHMPKSVERKSYKMYQQQHQLQTSSNSKLSTSFHHQQHGPHLQHVGSNFLQENNTQRKSLGGITTLNNSVISGINLYEGSLQNLTSLESQRQYNKQQRNLNQSQTYSKFKVKSSTNAAAAVNESHSFRKNRVSSKNILRSRYNAGGGGGGNQQINQLVQRSLQPLEELRNQFNYQQRVQSSSHALQPQRVGGGTVGNQQHQHFELQKKNSMNQQHNHTNLLIQQNDMIMQYGGVEGHPQVDFSQDINRGQQPPKYSTMTQKQSIGSARRLPMKQQLMNQANTNFMSLESTPPTNVATDTVMYLKQKEIQSKSQEVFQEGKKFLLEDKNFKDAIKSFNLALKYNAGNKDAKYYRAICYLDSDNPKKCITDLNELIELDPGYNQTIYVILSIAYRRENDLNSAVRALTKGLQRFPKYVEAYQARGQINIYLKKYEKALIDFQHVINIQPYNGAGYIGQADSMKGIGNFKGALLSYNQAIQVDVRCRSQAIFKRGVMQYHLKNFPEALTDFEMLLDESDKNAKAHFYKGKILKKQESENEAILHFEQVIKNTSLASSPAGQSSPILMLEDPSMIHQKQAMSVGDEELAGNALFEIAKIRIKQRDFYEAFHNLQRAIHYNFRSKKFIQYKMFVEGVLFLMKRKVKKGVKMLTALIEGPSVTYDYLMSTTSPINASNKSPSKDATTGGLTAVKSDDQDSTEQSSQIKPYLVQLIHVYRSYGLIILQQFEKALSDLGKAAKIQKLDQACVYNKYIIQALIKMEKKDLGGVKSILSQAEQKFPLNKDPYKFQAICVVQGVINDMVDIDNPRKKQAIIDAKAILDRALTKTPKDYTLLYLRGLLLFYMHNFYDALIDLDAVIDLEEEPTAKHYVARGRCHACLSMFQEAIADLSKAIELDEEISDAYFNRGKCAYLLGDTALAFLDFQKLILLEPKNPMVHIYAGNLLMTTGSYDDATKAFTNADSVQKSSLAFYQRSRCNIALANLDQALKDLNTVVERSPQDKIAYVDRECLSALKQAIQATQTSQNDIVGNTHSPQTKQGFDQSYFEKAVVVYTKLLNTSYDIESNIHASISAIRQHQQIIPNVKRIKIEKVRALRRKRIKDDIYGGGNGGMKRAKKIKQAFEVNDSTDKQLKNQAKDIEPFSYYKENIFGQEDFYLYRGVMNFYIGEYHKAIADFEQSIVAKQEQKEDSNDDTLSSGSNQTDLSDVGLCSLNVHESLFNIVLCLIQLKDYKTALEKVSKLVHESPKRYTKFLYLIRGLLYQALGNVGKSKGDLDVFQKFCTLETSSQGSNIINLHSEYIVKKSPISVNPFPLGTRLCSHFPEVKMTITSAPTHFFTRPSFSFPFVKPPNMIPNVEESVLNQEFSLKNAAPPKPEAPWIKRCDYGIKFTDEIQVLENNPSVTETEMTTNKDDEDEEDYDNKHQDSENEENNTSGSDSQDTSNQDRRQMRPKRGRDQIAAQELEEEQNERYYLRAFIKEHRRQDVKAQSAQQLTRGGYGEDLFRIDNQGEDQQLLDEEVRRNQQEEDEEELSQGEDEGDAKEQQSRQFQNELRYQLYGDGVQEEGSNEEKNIIVDDDEESI